MNLPGVSKTALLTLHARATEHQRKRGVLHDPTAVTWRERAGWDDRLDGWAAQRVSMALISFRAHEIDLYARRHLERVEEAVVVELGCGFSTRYHRVGGQRSKLWLEVDLPELIAVRDEFEVPNPPRVTHAGSAIDDDWLERLGETPPERVLIIAEGLLYYLPEVEVRAWFERLRARLPGAGIVFDVIGRQDFAALLENTRRVDAPIQWRIEGGFDRVAEAWGVVPFPEARPEVSVRRWVREYWPTLGRLASVIAYFAAKSSEVLAHRSGTVAGTLKPSASAP